LASAALVNWIAQVAEVTEHRNRVVHAIALNQCMNQQQFHQAHNSLRATGERGSVHPSVRCAGSSSIASGSDSTFCAVDSSGLSMTFFYGFQTAVIAP
jgi:hypothetical protein